MGHAARTKRARRAEEPPPRRKLNPLWVVCGCLAAGVLAFYWNPLTNPNTTPQWDAIDQHYSIQKFVGEELRSLRLPEWSDYGWSGFPVLADPQAGAWYPLNWPFFLAGVTPRALQWEIALHVLLACAGAWLLANLWLGDPWCAAMAAICYGFSGFFAGHASHLGMLQTAAWLPLVLFGIHQSIRSGRIGTMLWTGAGCAALFLAGHFQTTLYSFSAAAVYGLTIGALEHKWRSAAAALAVAAAVTVTLAAIQWMPAMELARESVRAGMSFQNQTNAPLEGRALWTLVAPDHYGSVRGNYTGPADRTQFYFYAGLALAPLALAGVALHRIRWAALALVVAFGWYGLGPAGGLYSVVTRLPGFSSVRAPVHAWFVVALGLALLAAAGLAAITARLKRPWLAWAVLAIGFADVMYWNSLENQLAYHRGSFASRYGDFQDGFERAVRRVLPEGTRLYAPFASPSFGPLNGMYDMRLPVTFGYNPLALKRYTEYLNAAAGNPNLVRALNVGARVAPETGAVVREDSVLPRFFFPRQVAPGTSPAANPLETASVEGDIAGVQQDPGATVTVVAGSDARYQLRCEAKSPSLLRAAIPWYPGWRASVDGRPAEVRIVDRALMGVAVPPGSHTVVLEYKSGSLRLGAAITLCGLAALGAAAVLRARRVRPA